MDDQITNKMNTIEDIHQLRSILENLSSEELEDTKLMKFYVAMFFKIHKAQHDNNIELFSKEVDRDSVESFCDGFDNPEKMIPLIEECKNDIADNKDYLKCAEFLKENYSEEGILKETLIKILPIIESSLETAIKRLDILEHQYRFYKDPKAVIAEQMAESKRQEEEFRRTHPDFRKSNSGCMVILIIMIISTLLLI